MRNKPYRDYPKIVQQLCFMFNSFIVGGAAKWAAGIVEERPRDIDIIVPLTSWNKASKLIPTKTPSNSFGGFKVIDNEFEIDIWTDDVAEILAHYSKNNFVFHPNSNTFIESTKLAFIDKFTINIKE